jgi:hypothetical protein
MEVMFGGVRFRTNSGIRRMAGEPRTPDPGAAPVAADGVDQGGRYSVASAAAR